MTSKTTRRFRQLFKQLTPDVKTAAKRAYRLWRTNSAHPGLRFKQVFDNPPVYSVRITRAFRALGAKSDREIIWFWIGSHDDYERVLATM